MKVIRMNNDWPLTVAEAHEREKHGDWKEAESAYRKIIADHPRTEDAWQRLILLYRSQKDYERELKTINEAIKKWEEAAPKRKLEGNKAIEKLSRSIAKSTGLMDKKGRQINPGQPLTKWMKRRETLRKKLK
jgi:tetratricopeptide (TPR) repeat protein